MIKIFEIRIHGRQRANIIFSWESCQGLAWGNSVIFWEEAEGIHSKGEGEERCIKEDLNSILEWTGVIVLRLK